MQKPLIIALAGNPNAGKTTLFNALTGAHQHVGNWPGVTVEKKEGLIQHNGRTIRIVDLPGIYSLTAYSIEELVARNYLLDEKPDVVIDIVDASNLDRNLYLTMQFKELGVPLMVCLNMIDMAEKRGVTIDHKLLSQLLGVPVTPTVARLGKGVKSLLDTAVEVGSQTPEWNPAKLPYSREVEEAIEDVERIIVEERFHADTYPVHWMAVKLVEGDEELDKILKEDGRAGAKIRERIDKLASHIKTTLDTDPEGMLADYRYGHILGITRQVMRSTMEFRLHLSDKIDRVLTNRILGPVCLLAILYGIFIFTFQGSEVPVGWVESFFDHIKGLLEGVLPEGVIKSLILSGVIDGVGGVITFLPLILFMFFAIAVLEDSGYMARVAYMLDRVLRWFGLHGNSVMALIVGGGIMGGCAVPGIMASRTLRDPRERLATLLVTPFMNCGAKIPVYALLIAAFFSEHRATMMFILMLLAWSFALFGAKILRSSILKGPKTPFVMELPPYRFPTFKGLLIHTWERTWQFLRKAGTVILAVSIIMWALMSFPALPEKRAQEFQNLRERAQVDLLSHTEIASVVSNGEDLEAFRKFYEEYRQSAEENGKQAEAWRNSKYYALARAIKLEHAGITQENIDPRLGEAVRVYDQYVKRVSEINGEEGKAALKTSIAGQVGGIMEHITAPLGFDWKINTALIGGFAAKEIIVSTLGTAFSLGEGDAEDSMMLSDRLRHEPGWMPLTAFTLMVFIMMYAPCFVTLICIKKETMSLKWALFALTYTTVAAYIVALIVYQGGLLFSVGV